MNVLNAAELYFKNGLNGQFCYVCFFTIKKKRGGVTGSGRGRQTRKIRRRREREMRGAAPGPAHLPAIEELTQLLVSCVEASVRGGRPRAVQDVG